MAIRYMSDAERTVRAMGLYDERAAPLVKDARIVQQRSASGGLTFTVQLDLDPLLLMSMAFDLGVAKRVAAVAEAAVNKLAGTLLAPLADGAVRGADVPAVQEYVRQREEVASAFHVAQRRAEEQAREAARAVTERRVRLGPADFVTAEQAYCQGMERLAQDARELDRLAAGIGEPSYKSSAAAHDWLRRGPTEPIEVSALPRSEAAGTLRRPAQLAAPAEEPAARPAPHHHPDHAVLLAVIQGKVEAAYTAGRRVNVAEVGRREQEILDGAASVVCAVGEERAVVELQLRHVDIAEGLSVLYDPAV